MRRKFFTFLVILVLLASELAVLQFVPRAYAAQNKFGYETIGASSGALGNYIQGSVFTTTEDGTADSITAALKWGWSAWTGKVKCAIYLHSDLSLKGATEERTITLTATFTWFTFNFSDPKPSLTAATAYVLGGWSQSISYQGAGLAYTTGDTNQSHAQSITYNGFPNPLVASHTAYKHSIYCTYTTIAPDTMPPTYSDVGTNTTQAEQPCMFYTKWTDETGLATTGGFIFGTNNTGSWQNETWAAFTANPDWSNVTKTLNTAIGVRVEWQIWANDTNNNRNNTGIQYLVVTTPESTFYSSTSDGYVLAESVTWSGSHDAGTGTNKADNGESFLTAVATAWGTVTHNYTITRSFFYFDTSSLPDNATITSVTLSLYKNEYGESYVSAQKGTQSDTLALADFDAFAGSEYGNVVWTDSGYKSITFNALGLSDINKTGTTKICTREYNHDYLNVDSGESTYRNGAYYSEYSGTVADPKLVVTWTLAVSKAWYGVSAWTASLVTRTWSSGTSWAASLIARTWSSGTSWTENLRSRIWNIASTWLFYLSPPQWVNVAVWTFSLLGDLDLISFALCFLALALSIYPLVTGEEKALPALAFVVALMGMALAYLGLWYALAVAALSFILSIAGLATRKD